MIGEHAEAGRAPGSDQSRHCNWTTIMQGSDPEEAVTIFFEDVCHLLDDQEVTTQNERRHWISLWAI